MFFLNRRHIKILSVTETCKVMTLATFFIELCSILQNSSSAEQYVHRTIVNLRLYVDTNISKRALLWFWVFCNACIHAGWSVFLFFFTDYKIIHVPLAYKLRRRQYCSKRLLMPRLVSVRSEFLESMLRWMSQTSSSMHRTLPGMWPAVQMLTLLI